ncbi:hypothetical protein H4S01_003616 [Coemansia sp. RSA 2610]|nr:hypothetical protein H4S01_003616 [Coemansia sp. RSA 2610]
MAANGCGGCNEPDTVNINLYRIIRLASDPNVEGIQWGDDGKTLIVHKDKLINEVLPGNFQTKKFTSFTRQYYIYNFTKLTDGRKDKNLRGLAKLQNEHFQRDRPELLRFIKRAQPTKKAADNQAQETQTERIRKHSLGDKSSSSLLAPVLVDAVAHMPSMAPAATATAAPPPFAVVPPADAAAMQGIATVDVASGVSSFAQPSQLADARPHIPPQLAAAANALDVLNEGIEHILDHSDLLFVRTVLEDLIKNINKILTSGAVAGPPSTLASPTGHAFNPTSMSSTEITRPLEQLRMQDVKFAAEMPAAAAGMALNPSVSVEPMTPSNTAVQPMPTSFIAEPTSAKGDAPHFPLPVISENAHMPYFTHTIYASQGQQSAGMGALGSPDMYTVAPPSAPILGDSPPMCSTSASSPDVPMTMATTPATAGPSMSSIPLMYPPPANGSHHHAQVPPLSIPGLDMLNTMPFGSVATASGFMHAEMVNSSTAAHMNFSAPRTAPASAHMRVASSPANVFYDNLQGPF